MSNKLYEEECVREAANALRLKNDGVSDMYTISEVGGAVLNLPFAGIPDYHYAEAGRVIGVILNLKSKYPNSICFGAVSDIHANTLSDTAAASARHACFALESVGMFARCDFIVNLGDNCEGTNIDSNSEYANEVYIENCTKYAMAALNGYSLVGNHDKSDTTRKIYDLIGKFNSFDVCSSTPERSFGYRDYTEKKVRLICLNTCDYMDSRGGNGMSYEQKEFLMKSLDLSDKNSYENWTVIILSHIPLDFLGGDYDKGNDLKSILKAYDGGSSVSIEVNGTYASAQKESEKYSGVLTYDYSGKNAAKVINIHGHIHNNKVGNLKFIDDGSQLGIVRISTPNASFSGNAGTDRYTEYGDYGITSEDASKIKKVSGTAADTSATFYFIDLENKVIHCIGYGADIDRTVSYGGDMYSIVYNLTNVSSGDERTMIAAGASYSVSIEAEGAAELYSVKVTMGGIDVTSETYSADDGTIVISSVTGDIVISASAVYRRKAENVACASRSKPDSGESFVNSNDWVTVACSLENEHVMTDREGNIVYSILIPENAVSVTVSSGDTLFERVIIKAGKGGSDVINTHEQSFDGSYTLDFECGEAEYMLLGLAYDADTKIPWGYDADDISVVFGVI